MFNLLCNVKIHVCYHISYVNNHTALLVGQLLGQAYFSEFDFHILDTTAYSDCVYQLVLTNACSYMMMTSPAASGGNCAVAAKREDKMLISSLDYQCTGGNHDSIVRIFVFLF